MKNPKSGLTCAVLTILAALTFTVHINILYATPYKSSDNSPAQSMVENNNDNAPSVLHLLPSNKSNTNSNSDTNTGNNTNTDSNRNTHSHSNNNNNYKNNNNNNNNNPSSQSNSGSSDVSSGGAVGRSDNSHVHSNDQSNQKNHHHDTVRGKNSNSDHNVSNHNQNHPGNKIKHKVGDIPFP